MIEKKLNDECDSTKRKFKLIHLQTRGASKKHFFANILAFHRDSITHYPVRE